MRTSFRSATAAFGAIAGSRNGTFDHWENGALAIGLDAGLIGGALIAPSLTWSRRRARLVLASTVAGALAGGMLVGLTTRRDDGRADDRSDLVAGCMTAGMWGGFGLGMLVTRDAAPDPKYDRGPALVSLTPNLNAHHLGLNANGSW